MNDQPTVSRREFLTRCALASAACSLAGSGIAAAAAPGFSPPLTVFSKVYQELKLDFDQAAAVTAEAGLDGVDIPVRPGGEIEPEAAAEALPRYAEALRKQGRTALLLTTAILGPSSAHALDILRAARKLGARYYRLGPVQVGRAADATKEIAETRSRLKELAALNRELGVTAVFQNHSPGGKNRYLGGDLPELWQIVREFNPDEIGVAFDLGHAINVHGAKWPEHFERLKSHVKVAYVKDVVPGRGFVRFGQGEFSRTDWFTRLKALNYQAPFSIHIEFDWSGPDKKRTRPALVAALRECANELRQWVAKA